MSLDIAILGIDGIPTKVFSIGVEEHYNLMEIVNRNNLLFRLNDYYNDSEFQTSELEDLENEVCAVQERCQDNSKLYSLLNDFVELIAEAKKREISIVAIAD
jgi:hypothetical protein